MGQREHQAASAGTLLGGLRAKAASPKQKAISIKR
jgi:hypothetical protein